MNAFPGLTAEGWMDSIQRDPGTVRGFRKRIEALLRDPAVARRVRARLQNGAGGAVAAGVAAAATGTRPGQRSDRSQPATSERPRRPAIAGCPCSVGVHGLFSLCDGGENCCITVAMSRPGQAAAPLLALF